MGSKNKDEIYHILDKYEVYWEDATSLGEWKDMEDARKEISDYKKDMMREFNDV